MNIKELVGEKCFEELKQCDTVADFFEVIKKNKFTFGFEQSKDMFELLQKEKHTANLSAQELKEVSAGKNDTVEQEAHVRCRIKIICKDFSQWEDNGHYTEGAPKSCLTCIYSQVVPYLD